MNFEVTITETCPWNPWEPVMDSLGSAKHTLGTTAIYHSVYCTHHIMLRNINIFVGFKSGYLSPWLHIAQKNKNWNKRV
jgi:hypothetical protein